jgi:hypothetical protein
VTILEALNRQDIFAPRFASPSWDAWRAFLGALFGLPLEGEALAFYRAHTQRTTPPTAPAPEAWVIVGRRGGKSRIAALVAVYLACFKDYDAVLAPGEVGTVAIVAADRKQSRVILRYINGFLDSVPALAAMVCSRTTESVTLNNRVVVEVHTASWRGIRGYTLVAAVCDEIAFWRVEGAANPDHEILTGLRPGMATVPGALLLCISTPYAHRGALYDAHRKHFGRDGDSVLVWQAPTEIMNPTLGGSAVIADAYERDATAARAEFGAEFRSDLESFVDLDTLMACVVRDRAVLPPAPRVAYLAAADAALGSGKDSFAGCVAHRSGNAIVIDQLIEIRPPFNPDVAATQIAAAVQPYGVRVIYSDRFAKDFVTQRFSACWLGHRMTDFTRDTAYLAALPWLTSRRVELPDPEVHPLARRMIGQFMSLERRTTPAGRDSVDHPRSGHDDVSCVVALAIAQLAKHDPSRPSMVPVMWGGTARPYEHEFVPATNMYRPRSEWPE